MGVGTSKALPRIVFGKDREEIEVSNKEINYTLQLNLTDKDGRKITDYFAVNNETKATLNIFISKKKNNSSGFVVDDDNWLTYYLIEDEELRQAANGHLEIPNDRTESFKCRLNKIHTNFIKKYCKEQIQAIKDKPKSFYTDGIRYKLERDSNEPGIRIDVYSSSSKGQKAEPIMINGNDRLTIRIIWNKQIEIDLPTGHLITYTPRWLSRNKWANFFLTGFTIVFILIFILLAMFHQQVTHWIRKRKILSLSKKKEGTELV